MTLACWGSALLRALLRALISYYVVAAEPPSKKPDFYKERKYSAFWLFEGFIGWSLIDFEFFDFVISEINWIE